jgi:hypothetical protein
MAFGLFAWIVVQLKLTDSLSDQPSGVDYWTSGPSHWTDVGHLEELNTRWSSAGCGAITCSNYSERGLCRLP